MIGPRTFLEYQHYRYLKVAIGMLELFVAFLQAYVFSFLATMFLSQCVHEH